MRIYTSNELDDDKVSFLGYLRDKGCMTGWEAGDRIREDETFYTGVVGPLTWARLVCVTADPDEHGILDYETSRLVLTDKGRMVLDVVDYIPVEAVA